MEAKLRRGPFKSSRRGCARAVNSQPLSVRRNASELERKHLYIGYTPRWMKQRGILAPDPELLALIDAVYCRVI